MKTLFALLSLCCAVSVHAAESAAPANPHAGMNLQDLAGPDVELTQKGTVLSTINVPQYTYIEVSQDKKPLWLAATTVAVKKGDTIRFDEGMVMTNFYSKVLKRTFPSIAFVNRVVVSKAK